MSPEAPQERTEVITDEKQLESSPSPESKQETSPETDQKSQLIDAIVPEIDYTSKSELEALFNTNQAAKDYIVLH